MEYALYRTGLVEDADLRHMVGTGTSVALWAGLGLTAAGTLGVDTSPFLASLGITGLTIGFAAREVAANYISGIMLVLSKPFERGDYIVLGKLGDEVHGFVEKTDLRYVYLQRTQQGPPGVDTVSKTLLIPNSMVYKSVIAVFEHPPLTASSPAAGPAPTHSGPVWRNPAPSIKSTK